MLGMAMGIAPGVLSFFFDDSKELGAISEGLLASEQLQRAVRGQPPAWHLLQGGPWISGLDGIGIF